MLESGMMLSNRYEVIETVGSGGMSTVYKAKCHVLNRYVAIKVLKPEFSSDVSFVSKFRNEAQSAAGLSHPNIVNVYDVGEDNGIYYIVMELVEGITLKEYIQQRGRLMPDQAIDFTIQIAQGLEVAHAHHTIHRDIKPQNIIVSSKDETLKVTDFGIAKAASSNTMTSNAMGSVHYISPEQARGGYSDERSDIYSLGITMYEMLTGHVPFEGENNVAIALMHIQGEMVSPREYYPDIPTSLEKILMKCTSKKPERRYLTANALIADLRRVQANPNIDTIAAVPPVVTNSPTVKMTSAEMQAIKQGRNLNEQALNNNYAEAPASEIRNDRPADSVPNKFDALFNDDDYDDEDEEETGLVSDDDAADEEFGELDPKLKKIIMISSIAVVVIIAILILVVIGKIAGWHPFSSSDDDNTEVTAISTDETTEEIQTNTMINLVGLYQTAAEEQLKSEGFTNYTFETQTSDTVETGYVIDQSVAEGTEITLDEEIIVYVSAGKETTTVPDVVGLTDDQATTMIEEKNLKVTHGYEYSDTVEKDHVIYTDPTAGTEIAEGSEVKIVLSNGKEVVETTVPTLVGESAASAESLLTNANLAGNPSYAYDSSVPAGYVISQDVDPNTTVDEGTTISYVISQGPETVTYTATFAGQITNSDYDFANGNVNVTVSYTVGDATYSLYSGAAGETTFPLDISSVTSSITGLQVNSGSFSVTVTDTNGEDVTSHFNTGGLSASFTKE